MIENIGEIEKCIAGLNCFESFEKYLRKNIIHIDCCFEEVCVDKLLMERVKTLRQNQLPELKRPNK
jgi:hypothetical protein